MYHKGLGGGDLMNKKYIILLCEILCLLAATVFSIIGLWSVIKVFSEVGLFLYIVILIGNIVYGIKIGKIKRI